MLDFLRSYNRSQKYKAEIRVEVENIGTKTKLVTVVVPVPLMTSYQITTPVFKKQTMEFDLELKPNEKEAVSVIFDVSVKPRRFTGKIVPEIIRANEFVISYLKYGNPIDGLYTADEAREKRIVDCGGFDALLQDELLKNNIESKIVAGFWSDGKMHAWLEIEGDLPADPSMEYLRRQSRTKKSGQLGFVGSDRIAFSEWKPGDEFLQKPHLVVKPLSSELSGLTTKLHYEHYFYCTRA